MNFLKPRLSSSPFRLNSRIETFWKATLCVFSKIGTLLYTQRQDLHV